MICPKCSNTMHEHTVSTLQGIVTIDRCSHCHGIWFDKGEAEILKSHWHSERLDNGDPNMGKAHNPIRDINCPHCAKPMAKVNDADQPHIEYEVCEEHGVFMDAGEFTDYKYKTFLDILRGPIAKLKQTA